MVAFQFDKNLQPGMVSVLDFCTSVYYTGTLNGVVFKNEVKESCVSNQHVQTQNSNVKHIRA
jgi:hypothetical protein